MNILQLINIRGVFLSHKNDKLPAPLAYKLMKFLNNTENDETFYNTRFMEICNEYCEKYEDGRLKYNQDGSINILTDKREECLQKLEELKNINVNTPDLSLTLNDLEYFKLTINEIHLIDTFIS